MTKGKVEKEEGEVDDDDNEGDEKYVFTMVWNAFLYRRSFLNTFNQYCAGYGSYFNKEEEKEEKKGEERRKKTKKMVIKEWKKEVWRYDDEEDYKGEEERDEE